MTRKMFNKTSWIKKTDINRKWYIVDATNVPLGRLATVVAVYLTGKHKSNYVPNMDMGDFVIVINVDKVKWSGKKLEQEELRHYTGYPGGLKRERVKDIYRDNPKRLVLHAVKGMLPKNNLRANQLHRLKLFIGSEHPHAAQKPEVIKI